MRASSASPVVGGEGIIAAAVGALAGGGGMRALGRVFAPQDKYYRGVIEDLIRENRELRGELKQLRGELEGTRQRVTDLELAQDEPPGYLA